MDATKKIRVPSAPTSAWIKNHNPETPYTSTNHEWYWHNKELGVVTWDNPADGPDMTTYPAVPVASRSSEPALAAPRTAAGGRSEGAASTEQTARVEVGGAVAISTTPSELTSAGSIVSPSSSPGSMPVIGESISVTHRMSSGNCLRHPATVVERMLADVGPGIRVRYLTDDSVKFIPANEVPEAVKCLTRSCNDADTAPRACSDSEEEEEDVESGAESSDGDKITAGSSESSHSGGSRSKRMRKSRKSGQRSSPAAENVEGHNRYGALPSAAENARGYKSYGTLPNAAGSVVDVSSKGLAAALKNAKADPGGGSWQKTVLAVVETINFPWQDRPSIQEEGKFLRGICVGLVNSHRGFKTSAATRLRPNLTRLLTAWLRSVKPDFEFTTVQINKSTLCQLHVDQNNLGLSAFIALGDFTGGELWVDGMTGIEVHNKWTVFNGNEVHCTVPFSGTRYSFAFFTESRYAKTQAESVPELKALGFNWPMDATRVKAVYSDQRKRIRLAEIAFKLWLREERQAEEETAAPAVEAAETDATMADGPDPGACDGSPGSDDESDHSGPSRKRQRMSSSEVAPSSVPAVGGLTAPSQDDEGGWVTVGDRSARTQRRRTTVEPSSIDSSATVVATTQADTATEEGSCAARPLNRRSINTARFDRSVRVYAWSSTKPLPVDVHGGTVDEKEEMEIAAVPDDQCKRCGMDDMEPHMICDGCDGVHHFKCFGIKAMVEGDWYCEECRPRTTHPSVACAIPPPSPATKAAVVAEPVPAAVKNSRASKVVGPTPSPPPPPRLPRPVDPALSTQDLVPNETPAHDRSRSSSSPKGKRKKGTVDATRGKLSHKTLQRHKALHANVVHDLATRGRKSEQFALMRVGAEVFICKNERVGHHDVTGKKAHVQNKRAVIMAEAVWPSTWLSVKVVETGEVVKVRTSNVILAMDAEHSV